MTSLDTLACGERARITAITASEGLTRKLLEMGFEEGLEVQILHEGPFGRDPIAIAMHDRCVALRRRDAMHIEVMREGTEELKN